MRRWRLFIGLGLGLVVLLLGYLAMWFAIPSEVRAFERIQEGMTINEVENVIGLPPGDYSSPARTRLPSISLLNSGVLRKPGYTLKSWAWDNYEISVVFDPDGRTTRKRLDPPRPSIFDQVRQFLGI